MSHRQDVQKQHSKKVDFHNSTWDALFHPDLCTHDFGRMYVSWITGAVYVVEDSIASFGGTTVLANNTAENGGTTVTWTRLYEFQATANKKFPYKRVFW